VERTIDFFKTESGHVPTEEFLDSLSDKVIIAHGFVKKTQKTPHGKIDRAEKYRQDYFARRKS
jgi:phage-related protein